jgi:hypothetical protein
MKSLLVGQMQSAPGVVNGSYFFLSAGNRVKFPMPSMSRLSGSWSNGLSLLLGLWPLYMFQIKNAMYMEKMTNPVVNMEILMPSWFCAAEWQWKKEE